MGKINPEKTARQVLGARADKVKDQLFAIHSRHRVVGDNQIDIPLFQSS